MRITLPLLAALASAAHAAPARLALVVGANRGDRADQPLRYAEADAARMARVLRELGGFQPADLVELHTPDAAALEAAMAGISRRADELAARGTPPLLLFYFSGHADEEALHLGASHFTIAALRRWLAASRSSLRVAVVDACRSGALTRVKGARAAPAIEVKLSDEIATRGEALLTSSTSDEQARESDALRGSFFTHHLVSGLRGAADRSKDGRVTLAEAYDYAYAKTVLEAHGGQHPTFKFDLAGRGDVVLTSLSDGGAWLHFPEGTDGQYLILSEEGLVLGDLEVGKTPLKVAVAPGRYEIRRHSLGGDYVSTVSVSSGEERWIHPDEMGPVASRWDPPKGQEAPRRGLPSPPPPVEAPPPVPPPPALLDDPEMVTAAVVGANERRRRAGMRRSSIGLLVGGAFELAAGAVAISWVARDELHTHYPDGLPHQDPTNWNVATGILLVDQLALAVGFGVGAYELRRAAAAIPDLPEHGVRRRDLLARQLARGARKEKLARQLVLGTVGATMVKAIAFGLVLGSGSGYLSGTYVPWGSYPPSRQSYYYENDLHQGDIQWLMCAALGNAVAPLIAATFLGASGRSERVRAARGELDLDPDLGAPSVLPTVTARPDGALLGVTGSF